MQRIGVALVGDGRGGKGVPIEPILGCKGDEALQESSLHRDDEGVIRAAEFCRSVRPKGVIDRRERQRYSRPDEVGVVLHVPRDRAVAESEIGHAGQVLDVREHFVARVNRCDVGVGRTCGEIVGHLAPSVHLIKVNGSAGVVGPEEHLCLREIVGGVQRVLGCANAARSPEVCRTFDAVANPTTVGVGVTPIRAGQVLESVGDAVAIEIVRQHVVGRIVLRIRAVKVLVQVTHAARIRVKLCGIGDPNVRGTVQDADAVQRTARGVLEVGVQAVTVGVERVDARIQRVRVVAHHLVEVVHAVVVCVGQGRVGEPTEHAEQFLPIGQTVRIRIGVVVVAVLTCAADRAVQGGLRVAEGAVAVRHVRRGCRWREIHANEHVVDRRAVGKGRPCARDIVPPRAPVRVETRSIGQRQAIDAVPIGRGRDEVHERIAWIRAVRDVALITVVDTTGVGVCDVPGGAGEVLFPVLDAVVVCIASVFTARRVGLTGIDETVAVGVLIAVVKGVAVGVVVARVAGLCGLTVRGVDLNAIAQPVAIGVESGRVGQEGERFVRVVQTVTV